MDVSSLYTFVLTLVLVGMVLGVGLLVLGKFANTAGIGADASTALNNTVTAVAEIPSTWLGLIVTITVLAIILTLVIRSFVTSGVGGR
jgi:hypothetical protein